MAADQSGVKYAKVHPKFLHGNSTSHTWPFSAIAEIIDNAYDPDVAATELKIDKRNVNDLTCLTFLDNGNGMNEDTLHRMLSFGYCEKVQVGQHKPIGYYGNGFKSGSMRLGQDAIVFTRQKGSMSVGFLSRSYLQAINVDEVFVPIVTWSLPHRKLVSPHSEKNMKAILDFSPFSTEKELFDELRSIGRTSGTKIVIYNLKEDNLGRMELDFDSDPNDIRNPETPMMDIAEINRPVTDSPPEYRVSLRQYCSILFLKPRMRIVIRGKTVRTQLVHKSLLDEDICQYKPKGATKPVRITFGFTSSTDPEAYGVLMYDKNRLIKAYEKVGYQKQPNELGVGVVGVVEADFLEPNHIKQDFNRTEKYNAFINRLGAKLNDYWDNTRGDGQKPDPDAYRSEAKQNWVQCRKHDCLKWRRVPVGIDMKPIEEGEWCCYMNKDAAFNRCEIPEEPEDEQEALKQAAQRRKIRRQQKEIVNKDQQQEGLKVPNDKREHLPKPTLANVLPTWFNRKRSKPPTNGVEAKRMALAKKEAAMEDLGETSTTSCRKESPDFVPETFMNEYPSFYFEETSLTMDDEETDIKPDIQKLNKEAGIATESASSTCNEAMKLLQNINTGRTSTLRTDIATHQMEKAIAFAKMSCQNVAFSDAEEAYLGTLSFLDIKHELLRSRQKLKETQEELAGSKKELNELSQKRQSELKGSEKALTKLREMLIDTQKELEATRKELKELREKGIGELKNTENLEHTKKELRELKEKRSTELINTQEKLSVTRKDLEETLRQLKDTQGELSMTMTELNKFREINTRGFDDAREELEKTKNELQEIKDKRTGELHELEETRLELQKLREEFEKSMKDLDELKEVKTGELKQHDKTMRELHGTQRELESLRKELNEVTQRKTKELKDTQEELSKTKKDLKNLRERRLGELKEFEETNRELKGTQGELQATRNKLDELTEGKTRELKGSREELEKYKKELKELKGRRTRELKELDETKTKLQKLRDELEKTRKELSKVKGGRTRELKDLETKLELQNLRELTNTRRELEETRKEIKELRGRRSKEYEDALEELEETKKELTELKEMKARYEAEVENKKDSGMSMASFLKKKIFRI